jgi:O-antigen ligase
MQRVAFALLMAALAAFLISELVPQETFERLTNIPGITTAADSAGGGSLERRRHTLNIALQIVRDNPVIGIGVGNWEVERFERDPTRSVAVPHNSYLLTWAEGGIFCLAAYLALFWGTVSRLGAISANPTVMARVQRDGLDWVVNALRTCIVSFTVFSLFADLWESIIFYLLIGEAAVLARLYPVRIRRSLMA